MAMHKEYYKGEGGGFPQVVNYTDTIMCGRLNF
jgi:hypothetical protein